jgi:uncharacterized delta-60 repeat protein
MRLRLSPTRALPLIVLLVGQVILLPPANAAAGDLDPTFGAGGKVVSSFGPGFDAASAVAVQPDGRVVIAGSAFNGDFLVARYLSNGSLDPSFGTGGLVTTDFGGSDGAVAVSVRSSGKILVAGATTANPGDPMEFAAARYNPDGSLDTSFGTVGKATAPYGASNISVAIEADGSFDLAGSVFNTDADIRVARYLPGGTPDTSFGTGGMVTTDLGAGDSALGIVAQTDGKLVVGGNTGNGADIGKFALARYDSSGDLDASFGTNGVVTTDISTLDDGVSALALRPDGRIVAVGSTFPSPTGNLRDFAVAQYLDDGRLDASFGTGGVTTTDFGGNYDVAWTTMIDPAGRIVAAGISGSYSPGAFRFALARFQPNGALDPSFGSGGLVTTDFPGSDDDVLALASGADGKIVAAGYSFTYDPSGATGTVALARYQGAQQLPPGPQISSFWPRSGPVGTIVTVTGSNLAWATSVTFDNTLQPSFSVDGTGTTLTTSVPAGAATGPVRIWTPFGAATSVDAFVVTTPITHTRTLSLEMWGHLKVRGQLSANDAPAECRAGVAIRIQRHRRSSWHTVGTETTLADGTYAGWIEDRPGTYRAKVPATTLANGEACTRALSPRTHES